MYIIEHPEKYLIVICMKETHSKHSCILKIIEVLIILIN